MNGERCLEGLSGFIYPSAEYMRDSSNVSSSSPQCAPCFFPHHCLANNTCLLGTTGLGCEVCFHAGTDQGYQLVGNTCFVCSLTPLAAIATGIYILLIILCVAVSGLSAAAVTKLKILINFVQLVYLSFFVKVQWPSFMPHLAALLSFSTFTSDIVMTECLLPGVKLSSYLRWVTAMAIPSAIVSFGSCVDRGLDTKVKTAKHESARVVVERRRAGLRYFLFLIVLSYYMPVALSAIQSFSCTQTFGQNMVLDTGLFPDNVFLYDHTVSCDDFVFQTLNFLLTLLLLVYIVLLPLLLIFFTLRQRKWGLLDCKSARYGFVYDSYNNRCCFWDSLVMVRKVVSIAVTNTMLTNPLQQSIVLLSISGLYLLLLLAARPYRKCTWKRLPLNIHLMLEVVCTVSLCMVQAGGLLLSLHLYPALLSYLLMGLVLLALVLWLGCAAAGRGENMGRQVVFDDEVELTESRQTSLPNQRIKRNQVGEYVTSHEVERRVAQVEF
ncbi:uncharacterized protein LOC124125516 isoform X1 [Haliotis rufescens]|uniref:uncharacterized protein LOC124125516 isoform X1 n=1 Tax=Haliotis rufescens TaxID=6454 RepID=UPI00201F49AF|nr:uncharacterized protein LOC124125516 isoform X1 [Haliotis rufescens]XP_048255775.1 uncharacterized protein LOC124125516 isoform X1 [Haliotis rufescens]XP_048255776.1 uncharacterized protein LOC124125516 isoform X1 [Haliotis rufescens]